MENGSQNGVHTNYARANGVKDGFVKSDPGVDKGKGVADKEKAGNFPTVNGGYTSNNSTIKSEVLQSDLAVRKSSVPPHSTSILDSLRINDLPDEIQHITADTMPLGVLLSRLAQISHNLLQELIAQLATRPIAQDPAQNGAPDYRSTTAEDPSPESLEKKRLLLEFIQHLHTRWVKALVITEWSRKADTVGRLIDLKNHIERELAHFVQQSHQLADIRKQLRDARLPSPDLKTALEVLSTGEVSWMPDVGYIEPPPPTPDEQLQWMENLNTLLSVRLTLDEYDKVPYHFRRYTIDSGRVTFKVEGEFEVDLTIADEDTGKQFWFIDFRFLFRPAPDLLSDRLRLFLEDKVNEALANDGLVGCYRFLHGFSLTHQVTEFTRQALELGRSRWVDSLKVERLNRAMSVQYWQSRPQTALKSWVILGTHSGKETQNDPASTSRLFLRWFRDNKEVRDLDIPLDTHNISAERILKSVIARHVEYILTSIHSKLLTFPRFSRREASLRLTISRDEPAASQLVMRLSRDNELTVKIDPVTGTFALSPSTGVITQGERELNRNGKDPVAEGHIILEKTRCFHTMEELTRRGKSMGWLTHNQGVKPDELRPFITIREHFQTLWLRRTGWKSDWSVLVIMSLGGDKWWLVQTSDTPDGIRRIKSFTSINITGQPRPTEEFFHNLNIFTTGMISQIVDLKVLDQRGIKHVERSQSSHGLPAQIRLPAVYVRLSEIVPGLTQKSGSTQGWAVDYVKITFKGAQQSSPDGSTGAQAGDGAQPRSASGSIKAVSDATITVADKTKFKELKGNVDSDVTFNTRVGEFVLHLRQEIGTSLIDTLATRLRAIGRLVDFVDAMRKTGGGIVCERVTMREIIFSYGEDLLRQGTGVPQQHQRWMARLDLTSGPNIKISLDRGNPHLRVLDLLENLANSENLRDLPNHLKLTFSILKALEGIDDAWAQIAQNDDGCVDIHHWSLDYTTITYSLPAADPKQPRRVSLGLKHAWRAGQDYWFLDFQKKHGVVVTPHNEFTEVLKPIFDSRGEDWKGLGTGAAGKAGKGIEELLSVVNNAVLGLVGSPPPPPTKPALPHPQLPVPGQGHSQSQSFVESVASTATPATKMSRQSSQQQRPSQQATQLSSQSQQQANRLGNKPTSAIVLD